MRFGFRRHGNEWVFEGLAEIDVRAGTDVSRGSSRLGRDQEMGISVSKLEGNNEDKTGMCDSS